MSDDGAKARKKEAKAAAKIEKARAKAAMARAEAADAEAAREAAEGRTGDSGTTGTDAPVGEGSFRAGLLRFVKEGAFQTIVKIVAGLVVGYLLIKFGLR
ncbi:MAG TPA: hypothetical protein VE960_04155 [bacterium]|nr:hypothetical protein [bacterium]